MKAYVRLDIFLYQSDNAQQYKYFVFPVMTKLEKKSP